jgi:chemotaxis protein CheZ
MPAAATEPTPLDTSLDQALAPHFAGLRAFMDRRIAELSAELSRLCPTDGHDGGGFGGANYRGPCPDRAADRHPGTWSAELRVGAGSRGERHGIGGRHHLGSGGGDPDWLDEGSGDTAALTERVNAIFQACSFQDLTGQRIRRAIKQLQQVETMLEGLMPGSPGRRDAEAGSGGPFADRCRPCQRRPRPRAGRDRPPAERLTRRVSSTAAPRRNSR